MEYINTQCNKVNEKIILFVESSQFVIKVQKNLGAVVDSSFLLDIDRLLCRNGNRF